MQRTTQNCWFFSFFELVLPCGVWMSFFTL
jgi:hypothetical protein